MKMMNCSHLVFRVDEGVIDALGAVAEVEDGVDLLSAVERLGGRDLTHALVVSFDLKDGTPMAWQ